MRIANNSRRAYSFRKIRSFFAGLKKILIYAAVGFGVLCVLALLYQALKVLLIGAILLLAWIRPKRWW